MTLTSYERATRRGSWRTVVTEALTGEAAACKARGRSLIDLGAPVDEPADAFCFFALGRLAYAFGREGSEKGRARMRPALSALALLVEQLLDETDPSGAASPPAPPSLPFRADLDG